MAPDDAEVPGAALGEVLVELFFFFFFEREREKEKGKKKREERLEKIQERLTKRVEREGEREREKPPNSVWLLGGASPSPDDSSIACRPCLDCRDREAAAVGKWASAENERRMTATRVEREKTKEEGGRRNFFLRRWAGAPSSQVAFAAQEAKSKKRNARSFLSPIQRSFHPSAVAGGEKTCLRHQRDGVEAEKEKARKKRSAFASPLAFARRAFFFGRRRSPSPSRSRRRRNEKKSIRKKTFSFSRSGPLLSKRRHQSKVRASCSSFSGRDV